MHCPSACVIALCNYSVFNGAGFLQSSLAGDWLFGHNTTNLLCTKSTTSVTMDKQRYKTSANDTWPFTVLRIAINVRKSVEGI